MNLEKIKEKIFVFKEIKKIYDLNKLTWILKINKETSSLKCLDKNSCIESIQFIGRDDICGAIKIYSKKSKKYIKLCSFPIFNDEVDENFFQYEKILYVDENLGIWHWIASPYFKNECMIFIYEQ